MFERVAAAEEKVAEKTRELVEKCNELAESRAEVAALNKALAEAAALVDRLKVRPVEALYGPSIVPLPYPLPARAAPVGGNRAVGGAAVPFLI